ncbi:DUF455 family protein [Burkholderia pseudomallei]|uniref:DUF455 family protein n=1 Tax=Burkholderia pseudomallei TaxID=28450 RepID=UPI0009B1E803|nr:DUF455 family protein [Burkholderia pseudomallei]
MDESRHASLLSGQIDRLGFELGCVPVTLGTWHLYVACDSIVEKIAAQHVLQEAIGLDVSAHNVARMRLAGDNECAEIFTRITADEQTHLALGLKWLNKLGGTKANKILKKVTKISDEIAFPPELPVVPELRLRAGYPVRWLKRECARRGSVSARELINQIQLDTEIS